MSPKRTKDQAIEPGQDGGQSVATATDPVQEPAADGPPANGNRRSFAETVGKKSFKPQPDPFGIASDNQAGIHLRETRKYREMQLVFVEKPSQPVIDKMKENGYRWNSKEQIWAHPIRKEEAMTTRIEAERLYQELAKMIREEKGIEAGQGLSV